MSTGTRTVSQTETSTHTKIIYVLRKLRTDLSLLKLFYGEGAVDLEKLAGDLEQFMWEGYLSVVTIYWVDAPGSTKVLRAIRYTYDQNSSSVVDDKPGYLLYDAALEGKPYHVQVSYSTKWLSLNSDKQLDFKRGLTLVWSAGVTLDFAGGNFTTSRTYSKEGLSLTRSEFR